jgi:diphthamide biosynthesis methyltransferase
MTSPGVLRRLADNAAATLHQLVVLPIEEREQLQRALVAQAAYSDLLAQLSRRTTATETVSAEP